ncbi:MAG: D-alanyl-D-alanine carboxypeptidase [Acaryochloris sp. RU_4_1]|nr:D-alanyl-D-alanine carboxypeptidase [Acaryochloris sp. RU_4_1]NJR55505.1 D-alanyl-D-alanine carboxypeptidase [Acaryochloris sp. CRU_2_0]
MLQLFSTGIIPLWLTTAGILGDQPPPNWAMLDLLQLNPPDLEIPKLWQTYVTRWSDQGFSTTNQGFWLQTSDQLLVHHNALHPLPAASLTKVATSLAALKTWEPHHQFITEVRTTGSINNGVLQGDLIIVGGGDPLFVGPEAISLAHSLNRLGIQRVLGNLVIIGSFTMDFQTDPLQSGERLRQGLQGQVYEPTAENGYTPPPPLAAKPHVEIAGTVKWEAAAGTSTLLFHHVSLPLYALLKQMNVNSNNALAETLATAMGGSSVVITQVRAATGVPAEEIVLHNGSGLGQENRLSPRAAVALLQGIQQELQRHQLTLADVLPMAGRDRGTLAERKLPTAALVKTGTLFDVSALTGVIPTRKFGPVWFTIINRGENIDGFRQDQDQILQQLTQRLGAAPDLLPQFTPSLPPAVLGDLRRNQIMTHRPPS